MQETRTQWVWLWIGAGLVLWFGAVVTGGAAGWFARVPAPAIPAFAVLSTALVAGCIGRWIRLGVRCEG